jgi:hypothetical protein
MLNPFKMFNRLAWLAVLLFGGGTAAMVTVVVLATGGLGSSKLVSIPGQETGGASTAQQPDVQLNEVVDKRPLFENVPLPGELSTESSVVATNFGLAILLALLFGIVSNTLNDLLREEEATFRRWFSVPGLRSLLRMVGWGAGQNVQRGCLTLPLIVLIFALYGTIFAFLERGLDIFSPEGVQLTLVMAMSVGLISLSGDVAQRQVARFWRRTARYGLYPANLLLAVVTTVFSRLTHLSPGVVFGVPGGVDVDLEDEPLFHEVILAFTTLIVMAVLGGLGWGAAAAIRAAGDQTMSASQADFAGPLAQLGLTIGLALFLVAIETSFFEMVPLSSTMGNEIFRWNPIVWFLAFTPVMFLFAHTLLNPGSDYLEAFENTNLQILTVMIVVLSLITAGLWIYFKVLRRDVQPVPAPPYSAPPPPYIPPRGVQPPPPRPGMPPPADQPRTAPPARAPKSEPPPAYVPPPIIISDNVPPPIVIKDEPPAPRPEDQTRARGRPRPAEPANDDLLDDDETHLL